MDGTSTTDMVVRFRSIDGGLAVKALSYEEIDQALAYDPEAGSLTWKIKPNRRLRAGAPAGLLKKAGRDKPSYLYVTYKGMTTTGARIAWLLSHKEWPERNLLFNDNDSTNIRLSNLRLGDVWHGLPAQGEARRIKPEAYRRYALNRYYGITPEEYGRMLADQKGLCAVCGNPETSAYKGKPRLMHVDHDHETGGVRGLLCFGCNNGLGAFKDDPARLRAAADYIERHRRSLKVVE
jgi:Recombination endonuclease VII